jgi:hypothetical protein
MSWLTWKEGVLAGPAVGVSLLPKLVCPLCSPAYAALLSSLGLGFLISTRYLLPLTLVFLSVAVGALGFRASTRRGNGPFWIGFAAAVGVLIGKFWFDSPAMTYGGVGLLVLASIWNAIPARTTATVCPACLPTEAGSTK